MNDVQVSKDGVVRVGQIWQDNVFGNPVFAPPRIFKIKSFSSGLWYEYVNAEIIAPSQHPKTGMLYSAGDQSYIDVAEFSGANRQHILLYDVIVQPEPPSPATFFNQFIAFLDKERPDWKSYPHSRLARIHQSFLAGFNAGAKR